MELGELAPSLLTVSSGAAQRQLSGQGQQSVCIDSPQIMGLDAFKKTKMFSAVEVAVFDEPLCSAQGCSHSALLLMVNKADTAVSANVSVALSFRPAPNATVLFTLRTMPLEISSPTWPNADLCPPSKPFVFGTQGEGLFCCGGPLTTKGCGHGICCLAPASNFSTGCQGLSHCSIYAIVSVSATLPPHGTLALRMFNAPTIPVPPGLPSGTNSTNLIFNGGMEAGPAGTVDGFFAYSGGDIGATVMADAVLAHSGRRSLRIRTASLGLHLEVMCMPIQQQPTEGTRFELSMWAMARSSAVGADVPMTLRVGFPEDGQWNVVDGRWIASNRNNHSVGEFWTQFNISGVAGKEIGPWVSLELLGLGATWIDDLSLRVVPPPPQVGFRIGNREHHPMGESSIPWEAV